MNLSCRSWYPAPKTWCATVWTRSDITPGCPAPLKFRVDRPANGGVGPVRRGDLPGRGGDPGSTSHYDHVCAEVSKGVAQAGLSTGRPVIFGVVTTDTLEQAIERAGTKAGNKGRMAAAAAIEMANLSRQLCG